MNATKKSIIILLLAMLLMFSVANLTKAATAPTPPPNFDNSIFQDWRGHMTPPQNLTDQDKALEDKALQFLTDVARLNVLSYHVEVIVHDEAPALPMVKH
jgi:hypothetical protein